MTGSVREPVDFSRGTRLLSPFGEQNYCNDVNQILLNDKDQILIVVARWECKVPVYDCAV